MRELIGIGTAALVLLGSVWVRRVLLRSRAPSRLRREYARVGRYTLHTFHGGASVEAPSVIMVHGWGVAGGYFVPLAERLSADHAVYIPELPGHGASEKPAEVLDVAGQAEVLLEWMGLSGIERAVFVGNSLGCQTIAELAVRNPERVAGLVLVGPTIDRDARSVPRQAVRLAAGGLFERPSLYVIVLADYAAAGVRRLRAELRHMFADAIERRLPLLDVPALVIRGGRDAVVPEAWASEVAAMLRAPLVTIPGRGHAVHHGDPDAVAAWVRRFVESISCDAPAAPEKLTQRS